MRRLPWDGRENITNMEIIYRYDGSFEGFLCCVFDSYVNKEYPACFQDEGSVSPSFFPARWVGTDRRHAQRVLAAVSFPLRTPGFSHLLQYKNTVWG